MIIISQVGESFHLVNYTQVLWLLFCLRFSLVLLKQNKY